MYQVSNVETVALLVDNDGVVIDEIFNLETAVSNTESAVFSQDGRVIGLFPHIQARLSAEEILLADLYGLPVPNVDFDLSQVTLPLPLPTDG